MKKTEYVFWISFFLPIGGPRWPSGRVSALGPEGSKPDSTEDPCMGLLHTQSYVVAKRPPVGVAWKFGEGVPAQCRPRHLTVFQNYEVRPKVALVLLQNGTLI
ncbi:hypothetical protein AVEN_219835-1 [Araneus ventricosus]|uniref:Uncharacterized protein n=1 Tax=Araneus ventricosus TaxID=182803 RepID=A0A4Y2JRI7_ARAVE|nr:hypothetical protein AVEN_219835-1 [Araneus ventricosus]